MAKNDPNPYEEPIDSTDEWEEVGDDNGELISFEKGLVMSGEFVERKTIELPEEKVQEGQDPTAEMLVFQHGDKRWSCWVTYQLDKAFEKIAPGDYVRIECTGERKATQGTVKIFSVKRRISTGA